MAISLAISAGRVLNNYRQPPALNIQPVVDVASSAAIATGAQTDTYPAATPPQAASMPMQGGEVGIDTPAPTSMPWALVGALGGLLLLGLGIGSSRVLQERVTLAMGGAMRTRDSDNFRLALADLDRCRSHARRHAARHQALLQPCAIVCALRETGCRSTAPRRKQHRTNTRCAYRGVGGRFIMCRRRL